MDKIKVMLADDQIILREGLKTIINLQNDMEVICEADNGLDALEKLKCHIPDIILMDIQMPVMNGVKATELIKQQYPDIKILILTTFDNDDYIVDALSNGAEGYLLKDIDAFNLVKAIHDSYNGHMMLPSKIASKLALRIAGKKIPESNTISDNKSLTQRELEIGFLMAEGMNNRQIAKKLYLSEGTVKNYISEIYSKLGTNNRSYIGVILKNYK